MNGASAHSLRCTCSRQKSYPVALISAAWAGTRKRPLCAKRAYLSRKRLSDCGDVLRRLPRQLLKGRKVAHR
jgi:hypothetical protein